MKKLALFIILLLLCVMLYGCKEEAPAPKPTEEKTLHTLPPSDVAENELYWSYLDCDIVLADSQQTPVLFADDFDSFALVEDDKNSHIIIKLTENGTNTLKSVTGIVEYSILLDNEQIATVTIDPKAFNGELIICKGEELETLYTLSDKFRNLY